MKYITYVFIPCLVAGMTGQAQQLLSGTVLKKNSTEGIPSVSIHNITEQRYDLSDADGSYKIPAAPGDHIAFSSVGYMADTITVTASLLTAVLPIYLEIRPQNLQAVRVGQYSNYQLDSMDRRKEYAWVYEQDDTKRLANDRQGADGVGVTLNIFRNSGTAAKQRIHLKKRLEKEEQDFYIDYRYNKDYVSKITKLKGDSLQQFMQRYRPSYEYCRKAANVDILVYISDSYKLFMKGDD
jgi:hypothetical protein